MRFDFTRPVLEKIKKNIFYFEKYGLTTKMKLINNTLAEAIVFAEESEIKNNRYTLFM